jgi:KaiC
MAIESSGHFGKQFQETMVAHVLRTPKLLRYLSAGMIVPEDFNLPIHRSIITAAKDVLQVLVNVPDKLLLAEIMVPLRTMINEGIVLQEEVKGLKNSLQNIFSLELASSYFESRLPAFLAEQRMLRVMKKGDIQSPDLLLRDIQGALASSRFNSGVTIKPMLNVDIGGKDIVVPCGISSIDERMSGGLGLTRSMMICGFTGIGKTALGINFALGSALQGYKARICQTELPAEEMNKRFYSRAARYSYDLLQFANTSGDILDEEFGLNDGLSREQIQAAVASRIAEYPELLWDNYGLYDYSEKTCTIQSLDFDWLECLDLPPTPDRNKKILSVPIKEMRHKIEKAAEELTALAVRHNLAMRIYTQSDFNAEDQAVVRMSNKSEAKGASRKVSWFLGIGATREDLAKDILTVTAGKSRNGRLFSCKIRRALNEQRFEDLQAKEEYEELQATLKQEEEDALFAS